MNSKIGLYFLAILGSIFFSTSQVLAAGEFTVSESGACPSFESGAQRTKFRRAGQSFVLSRDIELLDSSAPYAQPVARAVEHNFEVVRIIDFFRRGDESVLLFAQFQESGFCAWIRADQVAQSECFFTSDGEFRPLLLQRGTRPLRTAELYSKSGASCEVPEGQGGFLAKLILQNINQTRGDGFDSGIQVYSEPGVPLEEAGGETRRLKVADTFNVFDVIEVQEPNSLSADREVIPTTYYLIGRVSIPNSLADSDRFLIQGWVHERDTYNWATRFSATWAMTGKAAGFHESEFSGDPGKIVMDEPVNIAEDPNKVSAAYPLLQEIEPDSPPEEKLIHLVVPGSRCNSDPSSAQYCPDEGFLDRKRQELIATLESYNRIDALFLLDNSQSMDEYFKTISVLIPEIMAELSKQEGITGKERPTIRVAVATYGDYRGGVSSTSSVDYRVAFQFADISDGTALRRLHSALEAELKRPPADNEHDLREAALAAIFQAAEDDRWSETAGLRIIIHLADHGNREFGEHSGEYHEGTLISNLIEKVSATEVTGKLCAEGIYYAPIAVQGSKYNEAANGAFRRQAQAMIERAGSECKSFFLGPAITYDGEKPEAEISRVQRIGNGIRETFTTTQEYAREVKAQIRCIENNGENCFPEEPASSVRGNDWGGRIRDGLQETAGFDENQLRNLYGQSEPSLGLYFPVRTDGEEMFQYSIAVTVADLESLGAIYQDMCDVSRRSSLSSRQMGRALLQLVEAATAEDGEDEILSDFLSKINQFPARHLESSVNFLAMSWDETKDLLSNGLEDERRGYAKALCRTDLLLRQIASGKYVDPSRLHFVEGEEGSGEFGFWDIPDGERRDYTWDVPSLSGVRLFFIPLEYFMYNN